MCDQIQNDINAAAAELKAFDDSAVVSVERSAEASLEAPGEGTLEDDPGAVATDDPGAVEDSDKPTDNMSKLEMLNQR